jgi:hypothetical protein
MEQVERGAVIFMFAKGVGIIGIGRATAGCETLAASARRRLRNFRDEENTPEWRVPVKWLVWRPENAYQWPSPPQPTFWNVTVESYADFRKKLLRHFAR